jgi:hypothetical protein
MEQLIAANNQQNWAIFERAIVVQKYNNLTDKMERAFYTRSVIAIKRLYETSA